MQVNPNKESQYLLTLYELCKRNIISQSQKGELKDLLIIGDQKTQQVLRNFQRNKNISEMEKGILDLLDQSDESQSIYSIPSQYKNKRPKPVQVRSLEKNWACKSQDHLQPGQERKKPIIQVQERYSLKHLEMQHQQKYQKKRLSDNYYTDSIKTGF